jgi:isopentenyldiphosphate isomerase
MPISNAIQRGPSVYLYNEKGRLICTVPANQGLLSFTSGTVSVKGASQIFVFNEKGQLTATIPSR